MNLCVQYCARCNVIFSASQNKDASSVNYNLPPATLEDDSNAQNDAPFGNLDNEDNEDLSTINFRLYAHVHIGRTISLLVRI